MDGSTIGNGLIGVDALVGLFAVEEVGDEFDDTGNTSGTTDEDDFMNAGLVDLGVTENFLYGLKSGSEKVLAQLLETSAGEGGVEVDTIEEGVNFDSSLGGGGKSALSTFASRS